MSGVEAVEKHITLDLVLADLNGKPLAWKKNATATQVPSANGAEEAASAAGSANNMAH